MVHGRDERVMTRSMLRGIAFVLTAATVTATACRDGVSTPAPPDRRLVLTGRAERGSTVRVVVQIGEAEPGTGLAPRDSIVALAVTPSTAATVSGDSALLAAAGTINVAATLGDNTVLSTTVTVASPPTVVFEGLGVTTGRDIYKVALDGGDLVRLTSNPADDVSPSVATGTVVFTSYRDRNGELYSIGVDGTGEQRLTNTKANETLPALSRDGRRVAYAYDGSGVTKIWFASRDLSGAAVLSSSSFSSPAGIETSPAWNAASDQLILVATAGPSGRASLFTAAATSGVVPTIVPGSGDTAPEFEPAWNDDGRVTYSSPVNGATQIFVRDLRTSATTQLTSGTTSYGQPTWLPDGRIVFVRFLPANSQQLVWLDPAEKVLHDVPIDGLAAQHPSPVRP
jgi:Tol biopolymer transport system component